MPRTIYKSKRWAWKRAARLSSNTFHRWTVENVAAGRYVVRTMTRIEVERFEQMRGMNDLNDLNDYIRSVYAPLIEEQLRKSPVLWERFGAGR